MSNIILTTWSEIITEKVLIFSTRYELQHSNSEKGVAWDPGFHEEYYLYQNIFKIF